MKITINGDVTPSAIGMVLRDLENEHGLKVRDLTLYVRFVDKSGHVVEPKLPNGGNELVMTVSQGQKQEVKEQDKQLSVEQLKELLELRLGRPLVRQELSLVVSWVNDYHVTYGELNQAMFWNERTGSNFRGLDRFICSAYKARKEKEILNKSGQKGED